MDKQNLQPLKGFRDFLPNQASKRSYVLDIIRRSFSLYGFEPLETPALERQSLLLGKYGAEADKLIYKFTDEGRRPIGLRYDQTVPTARVIANNKHSLTFPFKRYQIQPVWRAEKPQKGRFREFMQCDIDIFGSKSPLSDAEIIATTITTAKNLGFTNLKMLINSRSILFSLINQSEIPQNLALTVIQTLDKIDKLPPESIKEELAQKKLNDRQINSLFQLIAKAKPSPELNQIIDYSHNLGVTKEEIVFSPTLARGLDYYTGTIFELICPDYSGGSLAGGGRYDHLINQLSGIDTPAVGLAFGFDRTIDAMEELGLFTKLPSSAKILVTIFSPQLVGNSISLVNYLRSQQIPAELYLEPSDKIQKQLKYANKKGIPYVAIIGEQEVAEKKVTVKDMNTGTQQTLSQNELTAHIKS